MARLQSGPVQLLLQNGNGQQRGMALVHVIHGGLVFERAQQARATNAEDGFLAQAIIGVAAVELIGDVAVLRVVLLQIGIEEIDGDAMAGDAFQVEPPCAHRDRAAFQGDRDHGLFRGEDGLRMPRLGRLRLKPGDADRDAGGSSLCGEPG